MEIFPPSSCIKELTQQKTFHSLGRLFYAPQHLAHFNVIYNKVSMESSSGVKGWHGPVFSVFASIQFSLPFLVFFFCVCLSWVTKERRTLSTAPCERARPIETWQRTSRRWNNFFCGYIDSHLLDDRGRSLSITIEFLLNLINEHLVRLCSLLFFW